MLLDVVLVCPTEHQYQTHFQGPVLDFIYFLLHLNIRYVPLIT